MTKKFCDIVRGERALRGLTQDGLAKELGVSKSTVAMWEIGERLPSKELYEQLADLFNVDIDYLYGRTGIKKKCHFTEDGEEFINANLVREDSEPYRVLTDFYNEDMKLLFDLSRTTQFDALMKYARYLKELHDKENNL